MNNGGKGTDVFREREREIAREESKRKKLLSSPRAEWVDEASFGRGVREKWRERGRGGYNYLQYHQLLLLR